MAYTVALPDGRTVEFPDDVPKDKAAAIIRQQFPELEAPQTTVLGNVKEAFKGLVPGAVGLLESAATGASALLPEDMEKSVREKIKSVATAVKEPFAAAPGYEDTVTRKLSEAVGSTAPFLLAGPFGLAGRAAAVGMGVGAGAGESRVRAEQEGATGEQRGTATALGIIPGALEAFAPIRILSRIPTASKAAGVEAVKRALVAGGEEAAQEAASGFAQNLIARGVYKPEQALIEGLGEQAAYGGATGAIVQGLMDLALGRRARGATPAPTGEKPAEPGPQLAPEVPAGTQGALLAQDKRAAPTEPDRDLFGNPVVAPTPAVATLPELAAEREKLLDEEQTPETRARIAAITQRLTQAPEQTGLDLDFQREYADMATERERLRQQPQTPEVKARVAELADQMALYTQNDIESIRAEKEMAAAAAAEDARARKKFPALAALPAEGVTPTAEPIAEPILRSAKPAVPETSARPGELSLQNVLDTGIAPSTTKGWFEKNVVGKTQAEVQAMVDKDPTLVDGPGKRAKILRELLAPQPALFEETPRVKPTPTPPPAVEQRAEPRAGEPSVGVPRQPAAAIVPEPGAGVPPAAGKPVAPVGRGLVSAGQPVVPGAAPQRAEPTAVTPPAERTADALHGEVRALEAEQQKLLTKAGRVPAVNSPARAKWDALDAQIAQKKEERDALDRAERKAQAPKAPAPAPVVEPQAPAETDAEEAARKAEAEDMKRRLDALEKAQRPTPAAAKAAPAAPKAEKAEPKEIPEKLREPVGTTDFGGEDTILRGPQGLLFPMSKREEREYAEAKQAEDDKKEEVGPATIKDERQGELDLRPPRKAAAKVPAKKAAPAQPTAVAPTTDVVRTADAWGGTVEFFDGTVGIIKRPHPSNGEIQYIPIRADGTFARNLFGIQTVDALQAGNQTKVFSAAELSVLVPQTADLKTKETAAEAKFPDGPFTGATSNVVAGDSVDPRYTNYLTDLMKSMGLGDVRVFLYHSADVAGKEDKLHLHGSYYPVMARGVADKSQKGGTRPIGPAEKDFMLFINNNMSEAETLEILSHELGHMIQKIAFDTAPANVRTEIKDAYDDWLASLKGKTVEDLVHSLRNRAAAELVVRENSPSALQQPINKLTAKDSKYWLGFDEWFADNVSRWATTADKPLTVADKFFSKVAQMMRDLVAIVTGRKYPPQKAVADFLDKMGPGSADLWLAGSSKPGAQAIQPLKTEMSANYTAEDVVNSMGELTPVQERGILSMFKGAQSAAEPGRGVKFRVAVADSAAAVEDKISGHFNGAVRDSMGKLNPMGLYRQAQDYSKLLLAYFQEGSLQKEKETGQYKVVKSADGSAPTDVFPLIYAWGKRTGRSNERAEQFASRVIEAYRLEQVLKENPDFPKQINDRDRALLVAEYNADPAFVEMSAAMDKPRIELIKQMVKVGRLSKEQGDEWASVIGYVPFDRIDDFAKRFTAVKKTTGRSPLMLTKNPELKGSFTRPVGNVFENYINTMGWMVGQVMTNDARVQTLRSLEDLGFTGRPSHTIGTENRTAKAYVKGELMYWELPSSYDAAAFQELNPPKARWLQVLGNFSNVLRKSVTILPPFALKQVTDDVQRAIMTSGVKNPGALLRMTLSNFGGLALAELRGIRHPTVSSMEALGLTGEFDFQQGKPAVSLLKDIGYRPRGKFEILMHRLEGITRASDLAVRKAIYDQTINESKDQLLAQTRAREFINFRRRGASDFVGAMVTTIPFFNAYIQGMDVLYRAASGKDSSSSVGRAQARRMFWSRAATVMMLSSLYALGAGDDEDYKDMDLRTRDSNWILPGIGKLSVPGELGALFKVIPERIVEYMKRQGTPEEQTAWEATRTALTYIMEQYVGRTVPVPQAAKPLLEAWTNYSFFTGRELEGIYQKQQDPSLRRASNTSELAIAISEFSRDVVGVDKISPIMIDNALSGYFGSSAGLLVAVTDSLLNPTRVDRPLHKYALVSNYLYDPVGTRRMTEFYETREKVGRANTTLKELMKTDMDKAAAYAESHADELMLESAVNSTLEQLENTRAYRKFLNSPDGAKDLPKEEREAQLKEVKQMELQMVGWLREAKASIRQ